MLAEIIAQFEVQLAEKDAQLARKDQILALAEIKIKVLEERLRLDRIARYGKRSETLSDLQLQLLDLEPGVSNRSSRRLCKITLLPASRAASILAGRSCPATWNVSTRASRAHPSNATAAIAASKPR